MHTYPDNKSAWCPKLVWTFYLWEFASPVLLMRVHTLIHIYLPLSLLRLPLLGLYTCFEYFLLNFFRNNSQLILTRNMTAFTCQLSTIVWAFSQYRRNTGKLKKKHIKATEVSTNQPTTQQQSANYRWNNKSAR